MVLAGHGLGYLCKVKMRRCREYNNINSGERDRASKGRHRKQKRMSIESADMKKIEHDRRSKPTEAAAEDRQMGMNTESCCSESSNKCSAERR